MKMRKSFWVVMFGLLLASATVYATPSTTYWTPAVMDIQPYEVLHTGVDNYFTVFRTAKGGASAFPTDAGLTMGVLPFKKLQMEVGIDLLEPFDNPVFFNAKIGTPEDALFKYCPGIDVGIFDVGTKKNQTDMDIIYAVLGKTIPHVGRIHVGPYFGNPSSKVFLDDNPDAQSRGIMVGFDHSFLPTKDKEGNDYSRLVVAGDYASGKNFIGGGGGGVYWYFTKDISLLTGPVWFNDVKINGDWKWTIQLDINTDLHKK